MTDSRHKHRQTDGETDRETDREEETAAYSDVSMCWWMFVLSQDKDLEPELDMPLSPLVTNRS